MAGTIFTVMIVLLLLGFPMMIPLITGATVGFYVMLGGFGQMETMVQQMLAGIRPASLIAVPMLIFAGIGPGLLILVLFSAYAMWYAVRHNVPTEAKATWGERARAIGNAIWPLGFPVIIIGGIYGGIFSPTEAAAVCVLYALILEVIVFRSISLPDVWATAKSTGLITAVVFILVGAGAAFSWIISFAMIPQAILGAVGIDQMGPIGVLFVISIAFFVGCMFVDPIVVILVLVPIFAPVVDAVGLDPVLVGTIITLQV